MTITIPHRFRGPTASANGGYTAGLLAEVIGGEAEVTLRLPPPLETPLEVVSTGSGAAELRLHDALVAEARVVDVEVEVPPLPSFAEAAAARARQPDWLQGEFGECFTCGTREDGSGLELHAGGLAGRGVVATVWHPREVTRPIVWAAIDCPGAFSIGEAGLRGEPVLGRMAARIERVPEVGEPCIVIGWPLGSEGRKYFAATALATADGEILARARQVWIKPRSQPST